MIFFLHDLSKLAVSTIDLVLNVASCGRRAIKDKFILLLQNSSFVNHDEFSALTDVVKNVKARQDQLEEKLKTKN